MHLTVTVFICVILPLSSLSAPSPNTVDPRIEHRPTTPLYEETQIEFEFVGTWSIKGSNWRRQVRRQFDFNAMQSQSNTAAASSSEQPDQKATQDWPFVTKTVFSTCTDSAKPPDRDRNAAMSPAVSLPDSIPQSVVVTAEVSLRISEACLHARRPYCSRLEAWLVEDANEFNRLDAPSARRIVESPSLGEVNVQFNFSFIVRSRQFQLHFRDRRGACLEINGLQFKATYCRIPRPSGMNRGLFGTLNSSLLDNPDYSLFQAVASSLNTPSPKALPENSSSLIEDLVGELDCFCPPGHARDETIGIGTCLGCNLNTYALEVHNNSTCQYCPAKSTAPIPGATFCQCSIDAYRSPGEPLSRPCSRVPTAPTQILATYHDVHTVTINWTEPLDTGGRDDISYQVQCVQGCEGVSLNRADITAEGRFAVIRSQTSLEIAYVTIRVFTFNGISVVAGMQHANYLDAILTLRVSNDDASYAHIPDTVFVVAGVGTAAVLIFLFFLVFGLIKWQRDRQLVNASNKQNSNAQKWCCSSPERRLRNFVFRHAGGPDSHKGKKEEQKVTGVIEVKATPDNFDEGELLLAGLPADATGVVFLPAASPPVLGSPSRATLMPREDSASISNQQDRYLSSPTSTSSIGATTSNPSQHTT